MYHSSRKEYISQSSHIENWQRIPAFGISTRFVWNQYFLYRCQLYINQTFVCYRSRFLNENRIEAVYNDTVASLSNLMLL